MKKFNGNPAVILLAEDNEGDARLAKEALDECKLRNELHHVKDGVETMEYLTHTAKYNTQNAPRPDVILLDLNMPRKDGREVLEEIRKYDDLVNIPVIVLTTSQDEIDVAKSYSLQANCYITKPVEFEKFVEVVKSIEHFWFNIVSLPDN